MRIACDRPERRKARPNATQRRQYVQRAKWFVPAHRPHDSHWAEPTKEASQRQRTLDPGSGVCAPTINEPWIGHAQIRGCGDTPARKTWEAWVCYDRARAAGGEGMVQYDIANGNANGNITRYMLYRGLIPTNPALSGTLARYRS